MKTEGQQQQYLVEENQLVRIEELLARMTPVDPKADQNRTTIASMLKTMRTRSRDNRMEDLEKITDEFDAELTRIKLHLTAAGIPETERMDQSAARYITPAERVAMLSQRLQLAEAQLVEEELAEHADTAEVPLVDAEPQEEGGKPVEQQAGATVIELHASKDFQRLVWVAYGLLVVLILLSAAASRLLQ